ncbi:MAG: patatin-like phospholipase family protein [Hyphomicrobiaceae bacterium]
MSSEAPPASALPPTGIFADLTNADRRRLEAGFARRDLKRGEVLVRQGDEAVALYIVVSGRFEVTVAGHDGAVAEIGSGSPIGEIAFLSGGRRTATVTAVRDSIVLRLERVDFDHLCENSPTIWGALTATLARRLADQTLGRATPGRSAPRTIAVIQAGPERIPDRFADELVGTLAGTGRTLLLTSRNITERAGVAEIDGSHATEALNALETSHDIVIYVADSTLTPWSKKAMRQADLVVRVGLSSRHPVQAVPENELERFASSLVGKAQQRLVVLHPERRAPRGTRYWLASRTVTMHHHVAVGNERDMARLARFITGTAVGLVACGGGAFCAAHLGLYKALVKAGVTIDMMGGTSGGSAMAAAFAMGFTADEIDRGVHDIFVARRALGRYTWPRYALLDHRTFDELLARYYGGIDIEDLWIPFFAVSTNLSRYGRHCHRSGELWRAIRASASIPALLPACYTDSGEMLVDGALVENVPLAAMRDIKSGPNIVLAFETPELQRFEVDYDALPGRGELLRRLLLPFGTKPLPRAPGLGAVLMRSLLANKQSFEAYLTPGDLVLLPPLPLDMGILDWGRHTGLLEDADRWASQQLARAAAARHPILTHHRTGAVELPVRAKPPVENL